MSQGTSVGVRRVAMAAVLVASVSVARGQGAAGAVAAPTQAAAAPAVAAGGTIRGMVKSGTVPLPGVGVTATNTLTGKKYATTTDVTGAYAMAIPSNGRYVVKTELVAFASETKEVVINAAGLNGGKAEQVDRAIRAHAGMAAICRQAYFLLPVQDLSLWDLKVGIHLAGQDVEQAELAVRVAKKFDRVIERDRRAGLGQPHRPELQHG